MLKLLILNNNNVAFGRISNSYKCYATLAPRWKGFWWFKIGKVKIKNVQPEPTSWVSFTPRLRFVKRRISRFYIRRQRIINYFVMRAAFWAISYFSKLHFVLWNVRFVIWLNFLFLHVSSFKLAIMQQLSYDTAIYYPKDATTFLSWRLLFFNEALILWRFKASDWSGIDFSTKAPSYDIITKYRRVARSPMTAIRFSFNQWLDMVYRERRKQGEWFRANRLPKRLRTPETQKVWEQGVELLHLIKYDMRFYEGRIKYAYSQMIYATNTFKKIF